MSQLRIHTGPEMAESQALAAEYSRRRAAELVGMQWRQGHLVRNPNARFAITDSTRDILQREITAAFEAETPIADLEATIRQSAAFSPARSRMIAATEVAKSQSMGTYEALRATGVV